ncbi:MAG: RNA polymerase factor sigma-54 [Bacteroidota bacterium]|jgi:RNA polymerase sigma-54 factor
MLKQGQFLKQLQKLSPQQIQLMKLLQLPATALEQRIKEELEANPALEEGNEDEEIENEIDDEIEREDDQESNENDGDQENETDKIDDELELEDYMDDVEAAEYKYEINNNGKDVEQREVPLSVGPGYHDLLEQQLGLRELSDVKYTIGVYLIGCIDDDGYLRRDLESIVDDIAFSLNISTSVDELKEVLSVIQSFDPPGTGARDLQECLLLQLDRKAIKTSETHYAIEIIKKYMDEFSKKHYDKIAKKIGLDEEELKEVILEITQLNPRPGSSSSDSERLISEVVPDFILSINDGKPELGLNQRNMPELKVSKEYIEMLMQYSKNKDKSSKEASTFVKGKIENAQWFIDALLQRQQTLLITMHAIIEYQMDYFLSGDETKLKPMILKDIAEKVGLDISTISRVANSKYIITPYGTFLLKSFFSESLSTESGEEVSTREVKKILEECIGNENKKKPLTDDALAKILKQKGYNIARRTVAKYREQLDIPVARLRKEI